MSPRRIRIRVLDTVVALICVACFVVPFAALSQAAERPQAETGGDVDQRVAESGMISNPFGGTFGNGTNGTVNGLIQWDMFTTSSQGLKLTVSTNRSPALHDVANGIDIPDYGDEPSAWAVDGTARRFGFTADGDISLGRFGAGAKWRGFDGGKSIEVGRKKSTMPLTRTTVRLRAEYGTALPDSARPTADILGTAVVNL
ncbi:MAG: hypothetical protein JWN41_138 [Thermoleophilia bacterium]|nr:hypothetical protein [Thermoleophilia bacterium]